MHRLWSSNAVAIFRCGVTSCLFYTRYLVDRKSYLPGKSHVAYLYYVETYTQMHSIRSIDNFTQYIRRRHLLEI